MEFDVKGMVGNKKVIWELYKEMEREANDNQLASFERVKAFKLITKDFQS